MPYIPTQTPNKINSYENNNNTKGDIQEDIEMYTNYFKSLKGRSETKTVLLKPIESYSKAKIDLPQPKKVYIKGLPMPLGMFIKHLYIV